MSKKKPETVAKAIIKSATTNPEAMAQAIVDIAVAARKLVACGLSRRDIVLLIQDDCGGNVSKDHIGRVLDSAASLDKTYLR